jgi:pimeloyl-ACP methyl ester carboxylesterase
MTHTDVTFTSEGVSCSGWHFPAASDRLAEPGGRPVVVMAHGFGGTKDSGLEPFAERISAAGADVLAFDYRGFGASEGQPRQSISIRRQQRDYHAAIDAAKRLPGVDGDRIALWGSSMSGAHVFQVAADRAEVKAVIAMTPLTSGLAAGRASVGERSVLTALKWTLTGLTSKISVARGASPKMMPLVAHPGQPGALALDGAYESYTSMAGPTWRNEIDASVGMEIGAIRTASAAKRMRSRLLVQIADFDRYVPAESVAKTAVHGRGEVHHYPCDHFDVWPGHAGHDRVAADQVAFLTRVFAPGVGATPESAIDTTPRLRSV